MTISTGTIAYLRFVECCSGTEIFFTGTLPIVNGGIYIYEGLSDYIGTGGSLQNGKCYTIYLEYTNNTISYPGPPTLANLSLSLGCEDPKCPDCPPKPPCNCPEGYEYVDGDCIITTIVSAQFSGELITLVAAGNDLQYNYLGLRLYPDITSMTWPILGSGTNNSLYDLRQANGAGPVVNPVANVQNEVWGKQNAPCASGSTGGRLNIAGIWSPGFPSNVELPYEFCITNDTGAPKQYVLAISGDNKVKVVIDSNPIAAIYLNANSLTTIPFIYLHAFPITLSPGAHTIKVSGINIGIGGGAGFVAELYDTTAAFFQANLMAPAVSAANCGTTAAQLEPYILFSTRDVINTQIENPDSTEPGVWTCEEGVLDGCGSSYFCKIEESFPLACDCYLVIPCDDSPTFVTSNSAFEPYIDSFVTVISDDYNGCGYIVKLENDDCLEAVTASPDPDSQCNCMVSCYYVDNTNGFLYVDADNVLQEVSSVDAKPYVKICSRVYPVPTNSSVDYTIIKLGACEDGECPTQCYKLTNCQNENLVIYSNSNSLLPYAFGTNNVVELVGKEGCWTVENESYKCECITVSITGKEVLVPADANKIDTFNGYNVYSFQAGTDTYYIWFDGVKWLITIGGFGLGTYTQFAIGLFDGPCPSTKDEPFKWIPNEQGYFINTKKCDSICDCPIDTIVSASYDLCETCIGPIAYKLTSCDNDDTIYTLVDLEAYIDKIVKLDCGCYIVEQIDILPPNPQDITLIDVYPGCTQCSRTYYELTDCAGIANPIITYTDLAAYVGKVIKVQDCSECWKVTTTNDYLNATTVVVTDDYDNCIDCGILLTCQCSTLTNYSDVKKTYSYYDCDRDLQIIQLQPGETSDRICLTEWVSDDACTCLQAKIRYLVNDVFEETYFQFEATGDTINGNSVYRACISYINNQLLEICYTIAFYDGCWYALYTEVNPLNIGNLSFPSFKLCPDLVCPTGLWEIFTCGCFTGTFTFCEAINDCTDTIVTFRAVDQINGYFYYNAYYNTELVQIKYNTTTDRWELIVVETGELLAYSNYKGICPIPSGEGDTWISNQSNPTFQVNAECEFDLIPPRLTTEICKVECECLNILIGLQLSEEFVGYYNLVAIPTGVITDDKPQYSAYINGFEAIINYNGTSSQWELYDVANDEIVAIIAFDADYPNCPVGTWTVLQGIESSYVSVFTEYCAEPPTPFDDPFSYIQYFGECQQGVCPHPVFKNNRTIRPGYNTPNCNPDEYDKITCRFADVMYKVVLEKRYGITNCCPDDDEKWIFKKELIDLQALKDPEYNCPDCPCACNSGKTYSSCNCGN